MSITPRQPARGLSFIELIVVMVIATLIISLAFRIWRRLGGDSETISEDARYYQVVGRFMAQLKMDLRSAVTMKKDGTDLVLTVNTEEFDRSAEIRYLVDKKTNRIVRTLDGKNSSFEFGKPPPGSGEFVFKLE